MKAKFLLIIAVVASFIAFGISSNAASPELLQSATIYINPSSGPPGTTVVVGSDVFWSACFANGASIGSMGRGGGLSYVVPQNASGSIEFYCSVTDPDGGIYYSNAVFFNVTQTDRDQDGFPDNEDRCPDVYAPDSQDGCPAVDSDGDTVVDSQDTCPQEFGIPEWDGCPDTDGDGLTTQYDSCPNEFGPRENGGCPTTQNITPSPTPTPQANSRPLPQLPATGACVLATQDSTRVNIRATPSTDAEIVGQLDPYLVYSVIGKTTAPDGDWYQIEAGWVAGFVVRTGGDCSTLQDTLGPTPITDSDGDTVPDNTDACPQEPGPVENNGCPTGEVVLADSELDLSEALQNCPQLLLDAQTLPIFIQLDIESGNRQNPCSYLENLLGELVFGEPDPTLSEENAQAILAECPEVMPSLTGMMDRLYNLNANAWQILNSVMNPENACEIAGSIATGVIPPEFANALSATSLPTPVPLAQPYFRPLHAPASAALIDTAISVCILTPISANRAEKIRVRMQNAGVQDTDIFTYGCPIVEFFNMYGDLTPDKQALLDVLQGECGLSVYESYYIVYIADGAGVDFPAVLAIDSATFCADIFGTMSLHLTDPTTDPEVAPTMHSCSDVAYLLKSYEAELTLYDLWIILSAGNSCNKAVKFIEQGFFTLIDQEAALPACLGIGATEIAFADGSTLKTASPWGHKITLLSQADICAGGVVLPPADTDGDGLTDDVDACPADFSVNPDGCPEGALVNTPPVVDPIPNQTLLAGSFINVGVVASDADADALTFATSSSDTGVANVIATDNLLTITGNNAGTATITVEVSDGTDTVSTTFEVTVNAPAPNTPPTVNPISEQTIQRGTAIDVEITASDADGDPISLSATSALTSIATVEIAGTTLTVRGVGVGSTSITVIANDGSTTGGTAFNVVVTAPPPAVPIPEGTEIADAGATPTRLVDPELRSQAAQAGINTENLDKFGLLELPTEFTPNANAVFQASTGEGDQTSIFIVLGSEITQPFEGTTESNFYPALDPTGKFVAFLTVDTAGGVTVRVLSIERNVSLPVLTDINLEEGGKPDFKIALFPPSWSPDGKRLLVTLVNQVNEPSIHAIDISDPTAIPVPEQLVNNVTAGAYAPNGRYVAFEHIDKQGIQNIYVMVETPTEIKVHPVTQQTADAPCFAPQFGADSLTVYFVCQIQDKQILYRYGIAGLTPVELEVSTVDNPAPGPGNGFLGFDDGATIYYGYEDGSTVTPMIQLENQNVSHIRWITLAAFEEEEVDTGG